MARVLPGEAIPDFWGATSTAAAVGAGRFSPETAYGFRLDLGFLRYVEAIEQGRTLRRVPVGRRRHRASWAASTPTPPPPPPVPPRHSPSQRGAPATPTAASTPPRLHLVTPTATSVTPMPVSVTPTVASVTPTPVSVMLRAVREQMASALVRLRAMEEEARALPELRRTVERLQEEKRLLLARCRDAESGASGEGRKG